MLKQAQSKKKALPLLAKTSLFAKFLRFTSHYFKPSVKRKVKSESIFKSLKLLLNVLVNVRINALVIVLATMIFMPSITAFAELKIASSIPKLMPQMGHESLTLGGLTNVAFSPDGQQVLTQSADGSASLWDIVTGRQVRRWVKEGSLSSIAFSHDGTQVFLGGERKVYLIAIQTGIERVFTWEHYGAQEIVISPNGKELLVGTFDVAILFDIATGDVLRKFNHATYLSVAISPDGKRVLTGSRGTSEDEGDGMIRMWDIATGEELRQFKSNKTNLTSVAFSPNGQHILTGTYYGGASLTDIMTGEELWYLPEISGTALTFSLDGTLVMTASGLRDAKTGNPLATSFGNVQDAVGFAFSPDSKHVVVGYKDNIARLFDVATGRELQHFEGLTNTVVSVAWSVDGTQILTAGYDDKAHLWNVQTGREVLRFEEQGHEKRWSTHNYGSNRWSDYAAFAESGVFSPDGQFVLTGGKDGRAILWDIVTGEEVRRFKGHQGAVWSVAFSPNGHQVLTGGGVDESDGGKGSVRLWDTATGNLIKLFEGHTAAVVSVAFSPSGEQVLTASLGDQTVRLWDINTGKEVLLLEELTNVSSVSFSPDGTQILIAHWSGVTLLNTDGKEIWSHSGGNPYSVSFSPDGKHILLAMQTHVDDSIPILLHAATGIQKQQYIGHEGFVSSIAFSPDGTKILSGSKDHTARIWDAESGKELAQLLSFDDGTWAVVDSFGRFDASNGGNIQGLHWVVDLEPIKLSQLKERYYEPGLLSKVLNPNANEGLREVEVFNEKGIALFPNVIVTHEPSVDDPILRVRLENRGGGIGPVQILVNGKEVIEDARPQGSNDRDAEVLELEVDLTNNPLMLTNQDNAFEVVAYNGAGYLASRPRGRPKARTSNSQPAIAPALWALVVGVSEYRGSNIDLSYAAKDADDFAKALSIAAQGHNGFNGVNIKSLTDSTTPATRDNLEAAFEWLKQAKPTDILVVYLAGHGITWGGAEGDYYYLLPAASSMEIKDKAVREQVSVSSRELTEWIKAVPALKQAFILDTCASGQAILGLTASRAVSASQTRSLERMKDRTGMFVLAGSAADAVSYEASEYGQGLLTYSLLEGMKGPALGIDGFVDVQKLFSHAIDRVPKLAGDLGGIQQPRLSVPRGGESFDLGQLQVADRDLIPLSQKRPLVLRTSFQDEVSYRDTLKFQNKVDGALRELASKGRNAPIVFLETDEFSNAYRLAGRYRVNGELVEVSVNISNEDTDLESFRVVGRKNALTELAAEVAAQAQRVVTINQ